MTVAHCVDRKDPKALTIRAGEWDTQTTEELFPHQERRVRDIQISSEYYGPSLFNDIAMIFLEQPVEITENVNIICLPNQDENFDSAKCVSSGWEKKFFDTKSKNPSILKRFDLPIVAHKICEKKLRETYLSEHFILHDSFICAGKTNYFLCGINV